MGFGYKYKDLPTPASVVFKARLILKLLAGLILIIQPIEFNHVWKEVITGILSTSIGVVNEVQDFFGTQVGHTVKPKDVEVIKDEAIKMLIFLILINTYLFFNT